MKYKVLVLDIDGTLTNSDKIITSETKKTLFRYQEHGGKIVLATGRPSYGVKPIAKELELERFGGFILSFNGGKITDCSSGEIIYEKSLPIEKIPVIYHLAKENGVNILTYDDSHIITEDANDTYVKIEARINKMKVKEVKSFTDYVNYKVTKCLMLGEGNYLAKVEEKVREQLGDEFNVFRSEPHFLEIMPQNIDKAYSLNYLLQYLGLESKDTIACGDGYNDVSMIKFAGLGVAMQNAQEAVKKVADYIAPSNDEDGVSYVVKNFVFNC